jgi:hypothetical protein
MTRWLRIKTWLSENDCRADAVLSHYNFSPEYTGGAFVGEDDAAIEQAQRDYLRAGGLVAFPTETLYGLSGNNASSQ